MDRNDLLRREAALKNELQPKLEAYREVAEGAKNDKGEDRAFSADEWGKHEGLSAEISNLTNQLQSTKAALKAVDLSNAEDDKTAATLGLSGREKLPQASDEYAERFMDVMRGELNKQDAAELAKMIGNAELFQNITGTSPSTGAVLIPTVIETEILSEAAAESPLLMISDVMSISSKLNSIPFVADIGVLAPRAEGEEYARTEPTIAAKTLNIFNFGGLFPVSMELMEDAPQFERTFSRLAARALADTVEEYGLKGATGQTGFTNLAGSGVTLTITGKVPPGILTLADTIVPDPTAGAATTVSYADVVNLMQAVKPSARRRGVFSFSTQFETAVMLLADLQGRPLWVPAVMAGQPSQLMGKPYYVSNELGAVAANATPALFGDFSSAHKIAIKKGMTIKRSEHFYFGNNMLAVAMDLRFGSLVLFKEFIAKLVMAAADPS